MGNRHPAYRKDIDGIRAVAILLVVAFHAFPSTLPGGFVGVDVFFVISGFLITGIILRNLQDGNFSFSDFYARRTRRIFPALFLILAASFVIGWYVLLPDEYLQLGKHIAAGSGFVQNFVLWQETGYFDRDSELKPLMHLWSLAVEEQFYLVFPLLMWALWRAKESILSPILVIGLFSFALNVAGIERDGAATFFLLHTRLWELVAGSLLACLMLQRERPILLEKVTSSLAGRRDLISACGLSLIVVSAVAIRSESAFPGWLALLPVCGTFMMILTGPETIVSRRFLAAKSMVLIGLISYPLYLWHWLLLSYHRIVYPHEDSTLRITGVVLASALLAWLTYRFVERPVRFASRGNGASIAVAAAVASMGAVGYLTYTAGGFENRFRLHHVRAGEFQYDTHWEGWSECSNISAPDPKMGGCRILHPGAPARIAVIGDSHAGHLASGLRDLFRSSEDNVLVMLHAGCNPFHPLSLKHGHYFLCPADFMSRALETIEADETISTVMMSGYAVPAILGGRLHEGRLPDSRIVARNAEAFELAMSATFERLIAAEKKVIYFIDNPELRVDPRACARSLIWHASSELCSIPRETMAARNKQYREIAIRAQAKFPSITFIDSVEFFCDTELCYAAKDGRLWYQTQDHLSPVGSKHLVESAAHKINAALAARSVPRLNEMAAN